MNNTFNIFPVKAYRKKLDISEQSKYNMLQKLDQIFDNRDFKRHRLEKGETAISSYPNQERFIHLEWQFEELNRKVIDSAVEFWKELKYIETALPNIVESWSNRHLRGDYTEAHSHNFCDLSVAYYLKFPKNSGSLLFLDPLEYHRNYCKFKNNPQGTEDGNVWAHANSAEDVVVIWPSWVKHKTAVSKSDESRIVITYNMIGDLNDLRDISY